MPSPFGAQAMPLGQLFADPNFIHVPSYQRSFAWTREEAGRLLDDVCEALDAETDSDPGRDYFLGPMLFVEPDPPTGRIAAWKAHRTGRVHDVVDGLQRLTTLTIMFCVLRDLDIAGEPANDRLAAAIGTSARSRLALRDPEEAFFGAYVRRPGATHLQPAEGSLSLTAARILDVREHLRQTLAEMDASHRRLLVEFLLDKCHIVLVSAKGIDRAHRMFEVLNATGRPLARNDILKAALLGTVPAPALNHATQIWDEAQARLDADFDSLFSHIRTIYRRNSTHIISGIQGIAQEHGGADLFITRLMGPAAAAFDDIRNGRHAGSPSSAAIGTALRHLGWLRGGDWVPPALLFWLERGSDPADLAQFLNGLDRLAYGLRILGMGTKRRSTRLGALLTAIRDGDDLNDAASPLKLTRDEQGTIRHNLRDLHARSAPMAKLVLLRLNEQMAGGPQELPIEDLTVEHLLPRKPGLNSLWREWYPDPAERGQCTESLGNLVLMTKVQNDKAGNQDFVRKHEVLFRSSSALPLPVNDFVRSQTEWRAEQVREREAELLRQIYRLWDISPPPRSEAQAKAPPHPLGIPEVAAGG
ncbi:MAG TPA: DUF262 domain-containing HNH endonuclease family protein [Hyphomicrobiaceae bacterium]|nr:DUF262 domain-containing HNH endonuclease family protein [Hyphomicrobiaceae bacterium]